MEIRVLNTIRGLAALIVVISHYSNETDFLNKILGVGAGKIGVMIFFLLSGFLLSMIYLNQPSHSTNIKKYLVYRVARVVPLFYFVVIVSFVLCALTGVGHHYSILNVNSLLTHLLFLEGFSVLWTVPVEIQFYVIFIAIWWFYSRYKAVTVLVMAIVILTLFWFAPQFGFKFLGNYINFNIFKSIPFFLVGMILGVYYKPLQKLPKSNWFGLGICFVFLVYPSIYSVLFRVQLSVWYSLITLAAVSVFFISWVFMISGNSRLFSNRVGDYLGKISYSMYLLHLPILSFFLSVFDGFNSHYLLLPLFVVTVLLVSAASYKYIEQPSKKFIRERFDKV